MKHKHWLTHLLGACFAFLFAVTAVGCLVTGWKLNIASTGNLLLWCGIFSVLPPLLLYFRFGGWVLLLLSIRGAFALWQDGLLWEQAQTLGYIISSHFQAVYKWPIIGKLLTEEYDLVLILLVYLTALSVSVCICRRWNSLFAFPLPIASLAVCLITTDTIPTERVLFLLILGIVLLLITDWIRRKNPRQFASVLMITGIPAVLALALLFGMNPQENYVNHAAEIQKKALTWFEQIKTKAEETVGGFTGNFALETLNLRSVGPKNDFSYTVMRVTSTSGGTVYLRGRDYDSYTGTEWESSEDREENFTIGSMGSETIQIQTNSAGKVLYTPYYTADALTLTNGFADNTENSRKYSFSFSVSPVKNTGTSPNRSVYTALPEETRIWAKALMDRMGIGGASEQETVREIEQHVKNSASYDLSTPTMDSGYTDFAMWFLEESDTGYCVHFATAAAVLLRASGIPARYVEGYMVSCTANEKTAVSNQDAHAWVEYYDDKSNVWRILEATPADMTSEEAEATEETDEPETPETEVPETEIPETEPDETDAPVSSPDHPQTGNEETTTDIHGQSGTQQQGSTGNVSGSTASGGIGSSGNSGGSSAVGGTSGTTDVPKEPFRIPEWLIHGIVTTLKTALKIFLIIMVIPVQAYIRMAWKNKRWHSGTPNEQAIRRWRQCRRMARLVKFRLSSELEELALRARFSQHTITDTELARFDEFRQRILAYVKEQKWYRRWLYRWVHALG